MLNLRAPGYELGAVRKPSQFLAIFLPILLGTQLFRGIDPLGRVLKIFPVDPGFFLQGLILSVCCGLAFLFFRVAARDVFALLSDSRIRKTDLLIYGLLPFVYGVELGFQVQYLLDQIKGMLPALGQHLGFDWSHLSLAPSPHLLLMIQILCLAAGLLFSNHVLNRLGRRQQKNRQPIPWRRKWPLLLPALLFAWLFSV